MVDETQEVAAEATEAKGNEFFDELVGTATVGEEITDPRAGKYDDAVLNEVEKKFTKAGAPFIALVWGGMTAKDGHTFDYSDGLYPPTEESLSFLKGKFMEALRNLEVVPQTYKNVLYLNEAGVDKVVAKLTEKIGQQFPITIRERSGSDFLDVRIRRRPKQVS